MPQGEFTSPEEVKYFVGTPQGGPCGGRGADMQVYSQNDGPVTILLDTDQM